MSEILKGSFLTDKKGRKMEIVDAEARAKAEENAAAIGELSEGKPYQQYVTGADGKAKWEDRLAYKDTVETIVLPETIGVVSEDSSYGDRRLDNISVENLTGSIAVGDTILVKWNDETYECIAEAGDMGLCYLGAMNGDFADSDYPFFIASTNGANFDIYVSDTQAAGTEIVVSLTKKENIVKTIPAEYLPRVVFDLDKKTCNVDFDTAVNVIQNGGIISIIKDRYETDDPRYAEVYSYPIYIEPDSESHMYYIYHLNGSGNVGYFSYTESGQILVAE